MSVPRTAAIDRFVRHLSFPENGCWEWTGNTGWQGYGQFTVERGKSRRTHRWLYEYLIGPVPEGLQLDHLCRNRACCNPEHLEPVTPRENILRSPIAVAAIHARKTHCIHGHSLDDAIRHGKDNRKRECRTCRQLRPSGLRAKAKVSA